VELSTVARIKNAVFRLVGTESDDPALTEHGEATDEVVYLALTDGSRRAQRWMLSCGYQGWRQRSSALTFSGTDAADGGKFTALPTDFLRAYGSQRTVRSALTEASGKRWGQEVAANEDHLEGDGYYFRDEQLWLTRRASPPTALYLDYHYKHPEWTSALADGSIDFPMDARSLIVGEAAVSAMHDDWLPGARDMEIKVLTYLARARENARDVARQTKEPRRMRKPTRLANHW
jgi:hypothetical protein